MTYATDSAEALAEVLRYHCWKPEFERTAHAAHQYHAWCAICRGDVDEIAQALIASGAVRREAEVRAEALRAREYAWTEGYDAARAGEQRRNPYRAALAEEGDR